MKIIQNRAGSWEPWEFQPSFSVEAPAQPPAENSPFSLSFFRRSENDITPGYRTKEMLVYMSSVTLIVQPGACQIYEDCSSQNL